MTAPSFATAHDVEELRRDPSTGNQNPLELPVRDWVTTSVNACSHICNSSPALQPNS
jgi:hypothetical protein